MVNKWVGKLSSQYLKYQRVWRLMKKPTMSEFIMISKVTAVGLLVIGVLGFAISILMTMAFY
ncbi:MAG: protein translocase SEC61 complex subunit gamma [archaeon]|nr:protein translocase SEC61 complex subunit gamma [archaeon]MCR4324011.1 protein translocase SEC61 complex subunit gamma [Nanoarchaeota archaeon]